MGFLRKGAMLQESLGKTGEYLSTDIWSCAILQMMESARVHARFEL